MYSLMVIAEQLRKIAEELSPVRVPIPPPSHFIEGDLVRCLGHSAPSSQCLPKGHVGVVRKTTTIGTETVLVEWESPFSGHNGSGKGEIRRYLGGYWMDPSNLELA